MGGRWVLGQILLLGCSHDGRIIIIIMPSIVHQSSFTVVNKQRHCKIILPILLSFDDVWWEKYLKLFVLLRMCVT